MVSLSPPPTPLTWHLLGCSRSLTSAIPRTPDCSGPSASPLPSAAYACGPAAMPLFLGGRAWAWLLGQTPWELALLELAHGVSDLRLGRRMGGAGWAAGDPSALEPPYTPTPSNSHSHCLSARASQAQRSCQAPCGRGFHGPNL